jgi:hypothetical protein
LQEPARWPGLKSVVAADAETNLTPNRRDVRVGAWGLKIINHKSKIKE